MAKSSNFTEHLLRLLILIGFVSLFSRALQQEDVLQLIHPQFIANAKLGFALLCLLSIIQLLRLAKFPNTHSCGCSYGFRGFFYYVFIGTLALCLLVPTKPLGSVTAQQKGLKHITAIQPGNQSTSSLFNNYELLLPPQQNAQASTSTERSNPGKQTPSPVIAITDSNHIRYMTAFYEYTEGFINKEVNMKGFVYRPRNLPPNQFMVTRFEISCCAADGMPSGLVVAWPEAAKFKNDAWVEVQGIITQGTYENLPMPLLKASRVVPIEPLSSPYVYTQSRVLNPAHQQGVPQNLPSSPPGNWNR